MAARKQCAKNIASAHGACAPFDRFPRASDEARGGAWQRTHGASLRIAGSLAAGA